MTKYGKSPWIDQFATSRVPAYPRQRGAIATEVAIVGGGLTGCATAYAFAAAGVKVALVEAGRIGRGSAGAAGGGMAEEPGVGRRGRSVSGGAIHVPREPRGARLHGALRRLDVKCHLQPQTTWDGDHGRARSRSSGSRRRGSGPRRPVRQRTRGTGAGDRGRRRRSTRAMPSSIRTARALVRGGAARGANLRAIRRQEHRWPQELMSSLPAVRSARTAWSSRPECRRRSAIRSRATSGFAPRIWR